MKQPISLPFFIPQLVKSPPFYIPEPPRIGHYREYPPPGHITFFKRKPFHAQFLPLANSITFMLGTFQFTGSSLSLVPKGARFVWGRSVNCLELNGGVSFARLTPSLYSLFFPLAHSFVPSRAFLFETPATQASKSLTLRNIPNTTFLQ